jgi:hypothetical protein
VLVRGNEKLVNTGGFLISKTTTEMSSSQMLQSKLLGMFHTIATGKTTPMLYATSHRFKPLWQLKTFYRAYTKGTPKSEYLLYDRTQPKTPLTCYVASK